MFSYIVLLIEVIDTCEFTCAVMFDLVGIAQSDNLIDR